MKHKRGGAKREFKSDSEYRIHLREQAKSGFLHNAQGNPISLRTVLSKQERSVLAGYRLIGSAPGKHHS